MVGDELRVEDDEANVALADRTMVEEGKRPVSRKEAPLDNGALLDEPTEPEDTLNFLLKEEPLEPLDRMEDDRGVKEEGEEAASVP
jgi:hypothetical protein